MKKAIIGKKVGMTQIFDEKGAVIPVTAIEAGPCTVVQIKTEETDGYNAVQLGFGEIKEKKLTKPAKGHFAKVNLTAKKHLREGRLNVTQIANSLGYQNIQYFSHQFKKITGMSPQEYSRSIKALND